MSAARVRLATALLGCLVGLPGTARAQTAAELELRVTDSVGAPVAGAAAMLARGRIGATADSAGYVRLGALRPGPDTITIASLGYATVRLALLLRAGMNHTEVALHVMPVQAAAVIVRAPARYGAEQYREFLHRKATFASGYFITGGDIRAQGMRRFSEIFRDVPGTIIDSDEFGHNTLTFGRAGLHIHSCRPRFFLDGSPYSVHDLDADFDLRRVAGVEVYTGLRVPARFSGAQARCGIVAVWTF